MAKKALLKNLDKTTLYNNLKILSEKLRSKDTANNLTWEDDVLPDVITIFDMAHTLLHASHGSVIRLSTPDQISLKQAITNLNKIFAKFENEKCSEIPTDNPIILIRELHSFYYWLFPPKTAA